MIEVLITSHGGKSELGRITIENIALADDGQIGQYSVRFAVERCGAVGLHQRSIGAFPRTRYNVLALLMQALSTLDPSELELEGDVSPSDLAWGQRGSGRSLPR